MCFFQITDSSNKTLFTIYLNFKPEQCSKDNKIVNQNPMFAQALTALPALTNTPLLEVM